MPKSTRGSGCAFDIDDFKGAFSFDDFFDKLVQEVWPSQSSASKDEQKPTLVNATDSRKDSDSKLVKPVFAEAPALLSIFKDARKKLLDLSSQADAELDRTKKEVAVQEIRHRGKLSEHEKGVQTLFESFSKLDARISGVGQTAARIGDHLQSADSQRDTANQTITLVKYLMEFNNKTGDTMELSPLFSDDSKVAEAAGVAQKLRALAEEDIGGTGSGATTTTVKGSANANPGLEVAVANLQEYCNELENRLLDRFDAASVKKDIATMAECAKILSQFNRGARAMQRYVASRPMFIDVEIMNSDTKTVLGDQTASAPGATLAASPSDVVDGLKVLYKEIIDTIRKESATIQAVFPSPDAVMSILVQRVMEQRVFMVLDKILPKPNLSNPTPVESGGLLQHLRLLAATYESTQAFAKELRAVGCGELDVEVLGESLFSSHRDDYRILEQTSLEQMFQAKMVEVRAGLPPPPDVGPRGSKLATFQTYSQPSMSTELVAEFIRWNDEAVQRCCVLTSQPAPLAANVKAIFGCLLDQVSAYTTAGLDRGQDALREAAALRERFSIGAGVSRRVAAAVSAAAESAAAAGETSIKSFMITVQRASTNVALVHQFFVNTIARILVPVDGTHASCLEEMGTSMSSAEGAALKGLRLCLETIMAEVERLLVSEQKAHDYQPVEDGTFPDHRPTSACTRVVQYLSRLIEGTSNGLEAHNKQAFMSDLGTRLHKALIVHWQRFTFSPSGGLRLKRDVSEFAEFVRSFKAPVVDEKFELLGTMVNVFIVAPESLKSLVEGSLKNAGADAVKFIQLREDYKSAKIANIVNTLPVQ